MCHALERRWLHVVVRGVRDLFVGNVIIRCNVHVGGIERQRHVVREHGRGLVVVGVLVGGGDIGNGVFRVGLLDARVLLGGFIGWRGLLLVRGGLGSVNRAGSLLGFRAVELRRVLLGRVGR